MKKTQDHYFHKAKKESYAARSIYKLQQIDERRKLLKPGQKVLDLGCCPGSWMQYASTRVGKNGRVIGLDLRPVKVELPDNCTSLVMDVDELDPAALTGDGGLFDVVLSDMAPDTSGIKFVDQTRSMNLCEAAMAVAHRALKPGGSFVMKIFQGPGFQELLAEVRKSFTTVTVEKPASSRKESKEIFIVGRGYRGEVMNDDEL